MSFLKTITLLVILVFVSSIITTIVSVSAQSILQQQSYMVLAKKIDEKETMASAVTLLHRNIDGNVKYKFVSSDNNSSSNNSNPSKGLLPSCPDGSELIKGKCVCPDGSSPKNDKCSSQLNPKPIKCPDGSSLVDGKCQCPDDSELSNGKCVCPPDNSSLINGKCPKPSPPGSLTFLSVVKKVTNNGIGDKKPSDFTITITGNNPSPSSFSGSSSGTSVTLRAGSYKVAEDNNIPGYTTSYSSGCSGTAKGGHMQCTITNEYTAPPSGSTTFLDVITNVINNNQGTKKPSDFTISVSGNNPSPSSFSGSSSGTSVTLKPGSYEVSVTERPSGYTTSYSSDCSGTAKGGHLQCTITNEYRLTPITAKLTVTKKVLNNGIGDKKPSDFTITITGNNPSPSSFSGSSSGTSVTLRAGSYKVTETERPSGYTTRYSSGCSGTVDAGQTEDCTITNEVNKSPESTPLVTSIRGFSGPLGLTYDSNNKYVYVTNYGDGGSSSNRNSNNNNADANKVSVIDTSSDKVIDTVSVGKKPLAITYNPSNNNVYVGNTFSDTVSVIDTLRNNNIISNIPVGHFPGNSSNGLAYNLRNGNIYVANTGSDRVSEIDRSTNAVVNTIKQLSNPAGIAYDHVDGHVYVTNKEANTVSVIDTLSNNKVVATIPVGKSPSAIIFDSDNNNVYVANTGSDNSRDSMSVIDTSTNKVVATIPVGNGPNGISLDSSSGRIYVTNTFSNNVSVIDDSKNKVITTISVGTNPYGIVYNTSNHRIYVADHGSNTISVIRP
jgi:YVTN family beta-propeller protein